jgi:hypothetical protein
MEKVQDGVETAPNSLPKAVKSKKHGGARPGAGRPQGPVPEPIPDQARHHFTTPFRDSRSPQDICLQAALGLLMEPDDLIWPALDRTHARRAAHLASLGKTAVSRPFLSRDMVRAIEAYERESEAGADLASGNQDAPGETGEPNPT